MSYALTRRGPLVMLFVRLSGRLRVSVADPEWRDSRPDSIAAPAEMSSNPGYPDWMGYSPEIQRLLR